MGCISCRKDKALLKCGLCECDVCKYCAQLQPEDSFSFLPDAGPELKHSVYCIPCFDQHVAEKWEDYQQTIEEAKNLQIYLSNQGKETRLIKRKVRPIKVTNCDDHNETILRLAFQAVKSGHNALVDVNVTSVKVRVNGYQSSVWSGTASPVNIAARQPRKPRNRGPIPILRES
jgi:hypothetical protein